MKGFKQLRIRAGLAEPADFRLETGYSQRSLTAFDNDTRDPPLFLVHYLKLLASGCQYCPNRKNIHTPTHHTKGGTPCPQTK